MFDLLPRGVQLTGRVPLLQRLIRSARMVRESRDFNGGAC